MSEINKKEIQSPEMQEVLSEIPGSLLKWGLYIFFAIVLILIIGSYFIKNPQIVTVPIIISTQNPPVLLIAKVGGEIDKMFVAEGDPVLKNKVISLIHSTCVYSDLKKLTDFITKFDDKSDWIQIVRRHQLPSNLNLGDIQSNYSSFQRDWKQLKDYLDFAYIPNKLNLLERQIQKKNEYNKELMFQKKLLIEDFELSKNSFNRDSIFYYQNSYSISPREFEVSRQAYIQKIYSCHVFNTTLINAESDLLSLNITKLDLQFQYETELKQYVFNLEESFQLLQSSISQWEEKYVIKSSIDGIITLTKFRNENQVIKPGETLATLIPSAPTTIVARAVIPPSGFGKIEIGQLVNIKLSGFPYIQFGVLKGRVFSLSQVPGEKGFNIDIELTKGMSSTYSEKIKFIYEMDGEADIITGDSRLIYRIIKPIRSIIKN